LLRRLVALGVAYAIAVASVIANVGAVRAEVANATSSGIVICHLTGLGEKAPSGIPKGCDSSCCIGCLGLLAAVPPPPTTSIAVAQGPGRLLPPPVAAQLPSDPQTKSHRPRAPPVTV
jgi:hypothetical protein